MSRLNLELRYRRTHYRYSSAQIYSSYWNCTDLLTKHRNSHGASLQRTTNNSEAGGNKHSLASAKLVTYPTSKERAKRAAGLVNPIDRTFDRRCVATGVQSEVLLEARLPQSCPDDAGAVWRAIATLSRRQDRFDREEKRRLQP